MSDEAVDLRAIHEWLAEQTGYAANAFAFVHVAIGRAMEARGEVGHVTAEELAHAYRQVALEEFGLLGREVLRHWGVTSTGDIGALVEALVNAEVISKDDDDRFDEFLDVYAFDADFEADYEIGRRVLGRSRN